MKISVRSIPPPEVIQKKNMFKGKHEALAGSRRSEERKRRYLETGQQTVEISC